MKTKTFTFNGTRYYIRGETDSEIFDKMVAKRVELEVELRMSDPSPLTVDQWFETFMKTYKSDILEYTYKTYEGLYKNAIQPKIGAYNLSSVKPIMCQQILNDISGLSDSYIKKTYFLLRQLFTKAYDNDLITKVPVKGLNLPKGYSNERRPLTDEERKAFLKASQNGRNSGLFCRIIYYCGLRPSEVKRIRGSDYKDGILHVRGSKTKASTRDVPIPTLLKLPTIPDDELLFHTSSGNPLDRTRVRQYWLAIKRDMGYPDSDLTLYCLRHDYCTRLQEAGIEIDIARRLMGHSSVEITSKIYTHNSAVTLNRAHSLINQYSSLLKPSNSVKKTPQNGTFPQNCSATKKAPKLFKFQGLRGAPRAIRTRNLLIRSERKNVDI